MPIVFHPLLIASWFAVVLAQGDDGVFPEDSGGRVVFVIVGVAIVALYLLLRRTRRRTEEAYWERRRREQAARDADPDMRPDDL